MKYSFKRTTTNYISSQNSGVRLYTVHACGMRKGNTAASETASNCRQQISVTDSFDFESQSRLHHCETKTARDKSILLQIVGTHWCAGFFCCPNAGYNWMTVWMGYDFAATSFFGEWAKQRRLRWGQGQKNDVQTDRRKTTDRMRQKECRIP